MSTIKLRYIKVYPKVMLKPGKTRAGALRLAGAAAAELDSMNYLTVYSLSKLPPSLKCTFCACAIEPKY